MGIEEAVRQLRLAIHDARVAFDCIGLGEIERAQACVITAKAAMDAADTVLRHGIANNSPERISAEGATVMASLAE
ncbi:hypothetical protein [Spirillospora sp. CA-294931]|uniref:hypothetical protein n=1 Tax=Spirillospora sp. CA-294931 TaxID=3240042 RepID=UPI003D937399